MAKEKTKRADLPFKILTQLEKDAHGELTRLLGSVQALIKKEIMAAKPDEVEDIVSGSMVKSLDVEIEAKRDELALKTLTRRILHSLPTSPNQLSQEQRRSLIGALPLHHPIEFDPSSLRTTNERGATEEEMVPIHRISYGGFNALELDRALQGKGEPVELIRQRGSRQLWTSRGAATVFANKVTRIPAIVVTVTTVGEVEVPTGVQSQVEQREEIERRAQTVIEGNVFDLPTGLEPLAEQAKLFDPSTLRILLKGEETNQERDAREEYERRDRRMMDFWREQYSARQPGLSEEVSAEVRELPRWKQLSDATAAAWEKWEQARKKGEENRLRVRSAMELTITYRAEDGTTGQGISLDGIYEQLQNAKRNDPKVEPSTGSPMGQYHEDEEVEVRDQRGTWHRAVVLSTDTDGTVKLKREDGQYRKTADPTAIRRTGEGNLALDNAAGIEYNGNMTDLHLPNFNVRLPAGSNSLRIEKALDTTTAEMNNQPLKVNAETWKRNRDAAKEELDRLLLRCHEIAGEEFVPHSSAACAKILFEKRGLSPQRVGKSGKPSVDEETLQVLQNEGDDLAGPIIEARKAQSCLSQLESWAEYAEAGRVQANWNQYGTPHGRYSCDTPNLQSRIQPIRETIEAEEGRIFLSIDIKQAEYVTWASLSGDPLLQKAFLDGKDFHSTMWSEIQEVAPNVDLHEKDPRTAGKTINFALLYLMQPFVLARRLGVSQEMVKIIFDAYAARAPMAMAYIQNVLKEIRRTGQTATRFGRVRYVSDIKLATGHRLHELNKTAWHHHNAGTAAEILKLKQVKAMSSLRKEGFDHDAVRVALQMHDELILNVRKDVLSDVQTITTAKFEEPIPGFIPFGLDVRTGHTWKAISK